MPVITIKMGKTESAKKKELIEKLTKTAVEVTSIPESSFMVFIDEYDPGSVGSGGQSLVDKMKGA